MKTKLLFFFFAFFCVNIIISQTANPVNNLEVCDDNSDGDDTNGFYQNFDLDTQTSSILGSQSATDYTVTYHESALDAANNINPIDSANPYSNIIPNFQTIYARVTDNNTSSSDTTSFDIVVNPLPIITSIVELRQCDNDTDGFSDFNLNEAASDISTNFMNEDFRFYASLLDAQNNINEIATPSSYTNTTVTTDTVWARVINSSTGCFRIAQVNLIVSTTGIPSSFQRSFTECDDFLDIDGNDTVNNDDTDGVSTFDFSSVTQDIINLFPVTQQLTVTYYRNETDALSEVNAITNPSNYRNIGYPNTQQIYIRVDSDLDNDCLGFGAYVNLTVNAVPVANSVSNLAICDDNSDGSAQNGFSQSINLESQTAAILGAQSPTTFSVTYHSTLADAQTGVSPYGSPFSNTTPFSQTIYVRVLNNSTSCSATSSFDVVVNPRPTTENITSPSYCDDDNDGDNSNGIIQNINLDNLIQPILGDPSIQDENDFTVTFHESQTDATLGSNALSSPFTNTLANQQTIYVRVLNNVTGCINTNFSFNITVETCLDRDSDNVSDAIEDVNGNGNLSDDDTDADTIPNYLDDDDDGDGVLTINEDYNNNGDPTDDDINNNGIPDYLDDQATLSVTTIDKLNFSIYPNPAQEMLYLLFYDNFAIEKKVIIYDTAGRSIYQNKHILNHESLTVDISSLTSGIYFIKVIADKKSSVRKLIVVKN